MNLFCRTFGKFLLIVWCFWSVSAARGSGFLFTAPRTFLSGTDENVCIAVNAGSNITRVKVTVLHQKEDEEMASTVEELTEDDQDGKCFKIRMPRTNVKRGRLRLTIRSRTDGDLDTNYVDQISIQPNPDIAIIQTDKPMYNGGQVVRFRIFTLRPDLTPSSEPVDRIWVENPGGVQLMQWLNASPVLGVVNRTFQLTEEPALGKWFVKMKRGEHEEEVVRSFFVDNYVLPKFSVKIRAPDSVSTATNVTICARYHFGEPVHGDATLQYYVKCSFSYYCQEDRSAVTRRLRLSGDGCVTHEIRLKNLSNFARSLVMNVSVSEDGTQTRVTAATRMDIRSSRKTNVPEFSVDTRKKRFKPGLPFAGQVLFKSLSGPEEQAVVCFEANDVKNCEELPVRDGKVNFFIHPIDVTNEKNFKAFISVQNSKDTSNHATKLNLVPWYSPSNNYIQLKHSSEVPLKCNNRAKFKILFSSTDSYIRFHYLIKSRGAILTSGTLDEFFLSARPFYLDDDVVPINSGDLSRVKQFEFSLNINPDMSPTAHMLVYYIRNDGEIVADTLQLPVEVTLSNKVKTRWGKTLSEPGSANNLLVESSPNSLCALSISDKSVHLLSAGNSVTTEKLFNQFEKFESEADPFFETSYCKGNEDPKGKGSAGNLEMLSQPWQMDSRFVDSLQAFKDFGAIVITDLNLETRPCRARTEDDGENIDLTMRNSRLHENGERIENMTMFNVDDFSGVAERRESPLAYNLRTYFPETWIWDLIQTNASGEANVKLKVPDSITEWLADTVCVSAKAGIGISDHSRLVTYRSFFLNFQVPHSLNKREIFHLTVSVFNYENSDLPVNVTFLPSPHFISRSEESVFYCIRPKTKVVHRFVLEAVKLGEAEVAIKAEVEPNLVGNCGNVAFGKSDVVVKKLMVKHEGFPVVDVKSGFICGGDNSNFDEKVEWNIKVPAEAIETSISVDAHVSGNILGPSLKNMDRLISLPTGCGEQNMVLLVPNLLLLDYLFLTQPKYLDPIERALKNLDMGYQRQLNYRRRDASYSAFGDEDGKGSIWLTSFVIRYLSQAKKYIYIDSKNLNASVSWIVKQQLENGCFPLIGKVYHRKLQEKVLEEESSKTLSAYVLISLIEAGLPRDSPVVKNTIYCLKPAHESLGTYGDLLLSYALILAGEYRDSQALMFELLKEAKRSYGMLWWENDDSIESAIEMTSYGILTLVKLGGPHFLAAASDGLRWIIQYQNQNGGFISSQDTAVALEAISKFSATLPPTGDQDHLMVNVMALDEKHAVNITNSNRLLQQTVSLPPFLTDVHFESVGKGCALVQTALRYHVKRGKPSNDLKVQLRIHSVSDIDSHSIAKFQICVRYKSTEEKINMAVLDVAMVSGYYPDRASLYEIQTSRRGVKRWEEYENRVNFYFEDLRNRKVCINFLVVRETCVENPAPATIKLYDYYNVELQTTMKYSLTPNCQESSWNTGEEPSNAIKQESKRDLRYGEIPFVPVYERSGHIGPVGRDLFQNFFNADRDLETPSGIGGVMPVYALPPKPEGQGSSCPHCLTTVPDIFPKLYCSSQNAIKVRILSKEAFDFYLDVTPRTNFTSLMKTVSFTMRPECDCPILNLASSFALLLVTPPRSFDVHHVQEIHVDDSVQLYPWGDPGRMPDYMVNAVEYCRRWQFGDGY